MSICIRCNQEKNECEFNFRNKKLGKKSKTCKNCTKQDSKQHYRLNKDYYFERNKTKRKRNQEWLNEYKSTLTCVKCGQNHIATIDFHHADSSSKDFDIGSALNKGVSRNTILKEIEKCIVLCSNCHRILHWEERNIGESSNGRKPDFESGR